MLDAERPQLHPVHARLNILFRSFFHSHSWKWVLKVINLYDEIISTTILSYQFNRLICNQFVNARWFHFIMQCTLHANQSHRNIWCLFEMLFSLVMLLVAMEFRAHKLFIEIRESLFNTWFYNYDLNILHFQWAVWLRELLRSLVQYCLEVYMFIEFQFSV